MATDQKRARKSKSPEELAATAANNAEKARLKAEAAERKTSEKAADKQRAAEKKEHAKAVATANNQAERAAKAKVAQDAAEAKKLARDEKARAKAEADAIERSPERIAARLMEIVQSHRHRSFDFYPIAEKRLIALAQISPAAAAKVVIKQLVLADQLGVCKAGLILRVDLQSPPPNLVASAFELAIRAGSTTAKRTNMLASHAIAATLIKAPKSDKTSVPRFAAHIDHLAEQRQLPADIAWLYLKGVRVYFRRQDAEPALGNSAVQAGLPAHTEATHSAAQPARTGTANFAADFDAAFLRLFQRGGQRSLVKTIDLRGELPAYSPAEFEQGLRQLREADRYSMETDHGGYSRLSDEERRAGIQEGSSLFVFVKRK